MTYRVLAYRGTRNLGDAIQAIAMSRLLPGGLRAVYRDAVRFSSGAEPFVVNGYLAGEASSDPNCLFCGVYLPPGGAAACEWLRCSRYPLATRDPATTRRLARHGLASITLGCATMTLPRYHGPRAGTLYIDSTEALSQRIPRTMSWEEQWRRALERLDQCRRSEVVVTTRLHVAVPCLAMGTAVVMERRARLAAMEADRLSLLDWLGFEYDRPVTMDLSAPAAEYKRWLGEQLQIPIVERDPEFPRADTGGVADAAVQPAAPLARAAD